MPPPPQLLLVRPSDWEKPHWPFSVAAAWRSARCPLETVTCTASSTDCCWDRIGPTAAAVRRESDRRDRCAPLVGGLEMHLGWWDGSIGVFVKEKDRAHIRLDVRLTGLAAGARRDCRRRRRATCHRLGRQLQGRRHVPHLNGTVCVARQNEASRSRSHTRRAFAFVHAKRSDGRPVDWPDDAHSIAVWGQSDVQLIDVGHHLLHKHLFVVLLAKRSKVVAGRVAVTAVGSV